jgi:hypothetical protein
MQNGYPAGSKVKIVNALDVSLLGRIHTVILPLQWVVQHQSYMYAIDLPLGNSKTCWVRPHGIQLVSLPFSWHNWAESKIIQLLLHNDDIAADLYREKQQGDMK